MRTHEHPYYHDVNHGSYDSLYDRALERTGTKPSVWRRDRFFNLFSVVRSVAGLSGEVVDCGIWKGLSTLLICDTLRLALGEQFRGAGVIGIDSFEGLSAPTFRDGDGIRGRQGDFSEPLENVRRNLSDYPELTLIKGWIPGALASLPERWYRLVHIDLDLVDPSVGAIEYFSSRMVSGGLMLCDDYASQAWPRLKTELDNVCERRGLRTIPLSTCQLLIMY